MFFSPYLFLTAIIAGVPTDHTVHLGHVMSRMSREQRSPFDSLPLFIDYNTSDVCGRNKLINIKERRIKLMPSLRSGRYIFDSKHFYDPADISHEEEKKPKAKPSNLILGMINRAKG